MIGTSHPTTALLEIYVRTDLGLASVPAEPPWTSRLLDGCAYTVQEPPPEVSNDDAVYDLVLLDPTGHRFPTFDELSDRVDAAQQRAGRAEDRAAALQARLRAGGIDPDVESD